MKLISRVSRRVLLGGLALLGASLFAQPPFSGSAPGVPYDWSHHHLVFSNPATQDQQTRTTADPRYWQQWTYRNLPHNPPDVASQVVGPLPRKDKNGLWEMSMGSGASVGAGNYPAKYSFNTASASCSSATSPDFVVYNTSLPGTQVAASQTGSFATASSTPTGSVTIVNGTHTLPLTATTGSSSGMSFHVAEDNTATNRTANAASLAAAIVSNGGAPMNVTASNNSSSTVTVTATIPGAAGNSITLSESLSDFSWTGSNLANGSSQATIVALDNLYTGCNTAATGLHITAASGSTSISFTSGVITAANVGSAITDTTSGHTAYIPANTTITAYTSSTTATISNATTNAVTATDSITVTPPVPNVYWAYDTATSSADTTVIGNSVILSAQGDQVAFVQSNSSGSSLVLLQWNAGEGVPPGAATNIASYAMTPTNQYAASAAASYAACPANTSCQLTLPFKTTTSNDTNSSPFYDYTNDVLYVGDDAGYLHKFTSVFNGTPAEAGSPWPVHVSSKSSPLLTSPVYDGGASQLIFVADASGYLYSVTTAGAVSATSAQVASAGGITDSPMVDSTTEKVYVFVGQDMHSGGSSPCAGVCFGVFQFPAAFTSSTALTEVVLGEAPTGSSGVPLYDGTFDNAFYTNPAAGNGNLWVCGTNVGNEATFKQIAVSAFVSGSTSPTATNITNPLTSAGAQCSPVSEFYNGSQDYVFFSVTADGNVSVQTSGESCSGACIYSYNVATPPTGPSAKPLAALASAGGSSGIVIDNVATSPTGGQQVYFTPLSNAACTGIASGTTGTGTGTGGCASQASQVKLQ